MTGSALRLLTLVLACAVAAGAAQPSTPLQAGSDVPAPERTGFVKPTFPPEALARGEQALVVVEIVIDEQGAVAEAKVLHGAEPFAAAALVAVKQWKYKVTKVDGQPRRVRHTVSMSFAAKLPEMKRASGVPELRQGVGPVTPPAARGDSGRAVVNVEIDPSGRVAESIVKSGDSPWKEALLQAIATWRFATPEGGARVAFEVRADFASGKATLELANPRRVETAAGETAVKPADAAADAADEAETVAPPARASASADEPNGATDGAPPIEVVSIPTPTPAATAAPSSAAAAPAHVVVENGLSSLRDVTLDPGIPDLVRGRRPVAPPLARLGEVEGEVDVRFSIDSGGATTVHEVEGREELKAAAEAMVRSWVFRRSAGHRVFARAHVQYRAAGVTARVSPAS